MKTAAWELNAVGPSEICSGVAIFATAWETSCFLELRHVYCASGKLVERRSTRMPCREKISILSATLPALARWQGRVVSIVNNNQNLHYQVRSRWSDARPVAPTPHDATRRHRGVTPEEATEGRTQAGPQKGGADNREAGLSPQGKDY